MRGLTPFEASILREAAFSGATRIIDEETALICVRLTKQGRLMSWSMVENGETVLYWRITDRGRLALKYATMLNLHL